MQHRADSNDGCHECNGGENHLSFEKIFMMWKSTHVYLLARRYHTRLFCVAVYTKLIVLLGKWMSRRAVVEWANVPGRPEGCPDVTVDAAIRDADFFFDFVSAEVLTKVCQDGFWSV